MRRCRGSIASWMLVVAVLAIDLAALRSFLVGGLDGFLLIGFGLQVGLACMIRAVGRVRRFWVGFEVAGLAAVVAYVGLAELAPESMDLLFINGIDFLAGQVPREIVQEVLVEERSNTLTAVLLLQELILGLPQVLVALIGGLLTMALGSPRRVVPSETTAPKAVGRG